MPNLDNVMPSDMRAAIEMNDLDKALGFLMAIAGIETGDVAAQVFDGDTTLGDATAWWKGASLAARERKVVEWYNAERAYAE